MSRLFALGVPEHMVARVQRALEAHGLDVVKSEPGTPYYCQEITEWLDVVDGNPPAGVPRLIAHNGPELRRLMDRSAA